MRCLSVRPSVRHVLVRQLRTQYVEGIYSNSVTLKSRLWVIQDHRKWHYSIDRIRVPISVHGAILYRLRDTVTYWSKIATFLYPTCNYVLTVGDPVGNSRKCLILIKLEWLGYRVVKKFRTIC